jgi:class 3 adenylate cyclase
MALREDLIEEVSEIFKSAWDTRDGNVVPDTDDLALGNEGVNLEAAVLYADMSGSTKMVDRLIPTTAAEIYKAYLRCAAKVISNEEGEITAYDGDRIMAMFIGTSKTNNATRAALKINFARIHIVNELLKGYLLRDPYVVNHAIGIDVSTLLVARTGIRGANDLVWVGSAANYAAKLSSWPANYTYITSRAYKRLNDAQKVGSNGKPMWESVGPDLLTYRSNWYWQI